MLRVVDVVSKTTVQQSARMLVAEIPGDIQIGALFPMHRQIAGTEGCGAIWETYGIQRAEIAMLTVADLNRRLPFRLGISIRDSCWTERIAMEQTIAFLREGVTQCSCCQTAGCQKKANPVVAIVGPGKSSATIAVQNLLQVFRIPQIGYSATTTDLSEKEQFPYFLRVVPSDAWQARAINQLLSHFNWTYIAVVYTAGSYGEKGFEAMERGNSTVCIAHSHKVKSLAEDEVYEKVLMSLTDLKPRPQVVVCFCEGASMRKFFLAQQRLRQRNPKWESFQWIGSDGWADRLDVVEGVEEEAAGSFSIRIHSPKVESFEPYYFSLNPHNHTRNPWFRDFWQQKFRCLLTMPKDYKGDMPVCTGRENLTTNYEQDPKLSQVINSIRVIGYALKAMHREKCRENTTTTTTIAPIICPEMENINGSQLIRYMNNVTFVDQFHQEIYFDENGDPPAWYDILNYVGRDGFRLAGDFRQTRRGTPVLSMSPRPKMFYDKTATLPESVCSKPCKVGQRYRKTTACCWICETCADVQIVNYTSSQCEDCPYGFWPTVNRTACFPLPHEYYPITNIGSIVALAFASIGILATLLTILIFVKHNSTPVVKSTTRELSYIILSGIMACYMVTFAVLTKPSFTSCFISRTLPPIAFSVIYSALLTKTNRIARILAGSKKRILTKKPRFLSTFSQVVITWILVGIQCIIVAVGVLQEMPQAGFDPHFLPRRMVLICSSYGWSFLSPFLWNLLLISLCTLYAIKTRNLPENFNEAKFIGFTMYSTIVVWIAFMVLHFGSVNKALNMSFSFSLSSSIALVLLFVPKLYIILFKPEKNVRSSYTTTKLIRCHFGNSAGMGDSKILSKTRTSSQSISTSGPTRTASLHIVNQNMSPGKHDMATQTEVLSRFARTFSVIGPSPVRRKTMDEDVMYLMDTCRRYQARLTHTCQDERLNASNLQNLLLEEDTIAEEEDGGDVGNYLAGPIRTLLSTVARTPPQVEKKDASVNKTPSNDELMGNHNQEEDQGFEKIMESLTGYCRPSVSTSPASSNCSSSFSDTSTSRHEFKNEAAFDSNNQTISDEELAKLSVRQLNMRLQGHDRETVSVIKQKRRTLKNRGYALNCRLRRIQNQIQVEADCVRLREQVRYLTQMVNELNKRLYEATNAQYYETAPTAQPLAPVEMRALPHTIAQLETYPPIQDEHAIMSNLAPVSRVSSNATAECFYNTI